MQEDRSAPPAYHLADLQQLALDDLRQLCQAEGGKRLDAERSVLVRQIMEVRAVRGQPGIGGGVLEILPEGFGFLRSPAHGLRAGPDDIYISPGQIERLELREGQFLSGALRPPHPGGTFFALARIELVDGVEANRRQRRISTARNAILPSRRLLHGAAPPGLGALLDSWTPPGFGMSILLRSPRNGRRLDALAQLGQQIAALHPDIELLAMMIGEGPAEVRRFGDAVGAPGPRRLLCDAQFDDSLERPGAVMSILLQRAFRLLEVGRDVILVLDSLTELARADNLATPHCGRILAPGFDASAVRRCHELMAAARQCEGRGSITLLATVLEPGPDTTPREAAILEAIVAEVSGRAGLVVQLTDEMPPTGLPCGIDPVRTVLRREERLSSADEQRHHHALAAELANLAATDRLDRLMHETGLCYKDRADESRD